MRAFLERLSGESKRRRFMQRQVDDELLRYLTGADQTRHLAFVCEADGALVGDARCLANADGASAELGIVVADDWHHTGIAQLLMQALMDAARARGVKTMQGIVLADNRDMLDFTRSLGFEASAGPQGTARIEKAL